MRFSLIILSGIFPLGVFAQKDSSVRWVKEKSWEEVKADARKQEKYIFVDCYATWCGPCKKMDQEVYTNQNVAESLNRDFIAVRLQMDSTQGDNGEVKSWYKTARELMNDYKIAGFPSFLLFSPKGYLVQRDLGYKGVSDFIELLHTAESNNEYYELLTDYLNGKKDYTKMPFMMRVAETLGQKDTALLIAKDYKNNYVSSLNFAQLATTNIVDYFVKYSILLEPEDGFFKLCYKHPKIIDSAANRAGLAKQFVTYVIGKEEIWNVVLKNERPVSVRPDWKRISRSINKKYGRMYDTMLVPKAMLTYYKYIKDWTKFANLKDKAIAKDKPYAGGGPFNENNAWGLNVDAWSVFQDCEDPIVLKKALSWIDLAIELEEPRPNVQYLDTRANLLYKLGRVREAVKQEEDAIRIDEAAAQKKGMVTGVFFNTYTLILGKMKEGLPTWNVRNQPANK